MKSSKNSCTSTGGLGLDGVGLPGAGFPDRSSTSPRPRSWWPAAAAAIGCFGAAAAAAPCVSVASRGLGCGFVPISVLGGLVGVGAAADDADAPSALVCVGATAAADDAAVAADACSGGAP